MFLIAMLFLTREVFVPRNWSGQGHTNRTASAGPVIVIQVLEINSATLCISLRCVFISHELTNKYSIYQCLIWRIFLHFSCLKLVVAFLSLLAQWLVFEGHSCAGGINPVFPLRFYDLKRIMYTR